MANNITSQPAQPDVSPKLNQTTSAKPDRGLGIDLSDDVETPRPGPNNKTLLAFGLSLFPIIGYIGAVVAGYGLWIAHHQKRPASGLLYAAVTLQLLYTIVGLTMLVIFTSLPQLTQLSAATPDTKTGQEFLNMFEANPEQATKYVDSTIFPDAKTELKLYQGYVSAKPQLIYSRVIDNGQYIDPKIAASYDGRSTSYQVWKVGVGQAGKKYLGLVVGLSADGAWRIIQMSGSELPNDSNARTFGDQLVIQAVKQ